MTDEDSHSVVVDIPKPRRHSKTAIHFGKRKETNKKEQRGHKTSKDNVEKFSLPEIKLLPAAMLKKVGVVLPYIHYSKMQEKEVRRQRMKIGTCDSYKVTYAQLQKRLHTDDPRNEVRTVLDFDPDFFKCVSGSFLTSYVAPYKSLKIMLNSQLGWRQEIGYRQDCMLNIDANYKKEQKIYNASVKLYKEQVKSFDDFISDDYRKSMESLKKWDEVKVAVYKQKCELQYLAAKAFTIASRLIGLDYRYKVQQKYGRFLFYLSPPSWRFRNRIFAKSIEIEEKGFDFGHSNEEDTFNKMFEKLKLECKYGLVKPVLYFEHPGDLMKIFENIEQQHLHHFVHVVQLAPHATHLKKGIKMFKQIIAQDSAGILMTIQNFEKLLQFSEQQCTLLRDKFFKILNGLFYESVGAPEVLKLKMHLEFCYEKVYNEKPINMDIVATAKALEHVYMNYSMRLDAVTGDEINAAMKQYMESERLKYKRAKEAARELYLFERLERNLNRAFAPAADPSGTFRVKRDSRRKIVSKSKLRENRSSLTEAQEEYLNLFTDWTEKEDPAKYLHVLPDDKPSK